MSRLHAGVLALASSIAATLVATGACAQPIASADASAAAKPAIVEQPRPFGYVLGDLLTQRVLLDSGSSQFEAAEFPRPQRLNVWFERRASKLEQRSDGRRWLIVEYQLINAPQTLTTVTLPAWTLESADGASSVSVPEWPISVNALTPRASFEIGGLGELRPDRAAPVIPTAPIRRRLLIWSIAFVLTLVAWFAWFRWREHREAQNQPFARALHEMRTMDEAAPEAWQALHRAFDQTAGRVLQPTMLSILFDRAPHLQPLRREIERFYALSSERFFGSGRSDDGMLSVRALCADLRRIEQRVGEP